jgi:hypothetical protein
MTPDADAYVRLARRLPRPTLAQTERFARFVSGAHSWYKHLPLAPKVPFAFYLDAGAGLSLVRTRTGETALVEITDQSPRFHYTWQKTEDYRRRFGHWNYHAAYGTSFRFAGEGGVVSTAGAGPKVLAESGDWVGVPADLAGRGTALVSALVHPCPNFLIWASDPQRFGLSEVPGSGDAGFPAGAHPVLRRLARLIEQERRRHPGLSEMVNSVPPHLLQAGGHPVAGRSGATWLWPTEADWDWPTEGWLEQLRAGGVGERLVSFAVKYVEAGQVRRLTERAYRDRKEEPPEWPTGVMLRLVGALAEERGWQLAAMAEAMGRFAEAVYR